MSEKLNTYTLVNWLGQPNSDYWVRSGGVFWIQHTGGRVPKSSSDKIKRTVKAKDFFDLDWSVTGTLKPDSDIGWLEPSGKFWGCDYQCHDALALLVLKKEVKEIESLRWIRVDGENDFRFSGHGRLTAEQRNWLSAHGGVLKDWM